jgi:hypothetical protein
VSALPHRPRPAVPPDEPVAGVPEPLSAIVMKLLGRWRDALREVLAPNGQLIVNLIPELELLIGRQPLVMEQISS